MKFRATDLAETLCEEGEVVKKGDVKAATLNRAIARGLADSEAGRTSPTAAVFDRLEGKYRAMKGKEMDSG